MSLLKSELRIENQTAQSSDWAVVVWALGLTAVSSLALAETNSVALITGAILLVLLPKKVGAIRRLSLSVLGLFSFAVGPVGLLFSTPAALFVAAMPGTAALTAMALASAALLAHHAQSVSELAVFSIHPGSTTFVVIPTLVAVVCFGKQIGWWDSLCLIGAALGVILILEVAAGIWIEPTLIASALFRTLMALLPIAIVAPWMGRPRFHAENFSPKWFVASVSVGAAASLFIPVSPINLIVFDESHGRWETVTASFGPNDYGRSANYTYSLLADYAEKIAGTSSTLDSEAQNLPGTGAAFVLKMPSEPLSKAFGDRLENWIRRGGRLLVVADHTDLFDSAQNLNEFLYPRLGVKINTDAVFDVRGMPTVQRISKLTALLGRIDAYDLPVAWQTGSSLAAMPANAVELATFGTSFSELGDYSRPNRFGIFVPRVSQRIAEHTAMLAFSVDRGAVAVITDSTPWSNFSIFKEPYKQLFNGAIHALSRPVALKLWGWGALLLLVVTLFVSFHRAGPPIVIGGAILGLTFGAAFQVGIASYEDPNEGREFTLKVVTGSSAQTEFLDRLTGPGERSYSRIISAMSKYRLAPLASTPGREVPSLSDAKKWLLVQPESRQLPSFQDTIAHIKSGGDLAVLFSPEQAASSEVQKWLRGMGLHTKERVALAVAEDTTSGNEGILGRRGASILRDARSVTTANASSVLKGANNDQLLQTYTVRPTQFPRTSGTLAIGFSADQFSDAAIGDVWEGIDPSSIGMLRERQMAAVLTDKDLPKPFPQELYVPLSIQPDLKLPAYLVTEGGKVILRGRFDKKSVPHGLRISPIEAPVDYLKDLQSRAASFIGEQCPRKEPMTRCEMRVLGGAMMEWMVSWVSDDNGEIKAIELLHQKSFSGLGKTVNVVFSK